MGRKKKAARTKQAGEAAAAVAKAKRPLLIVTLVLAAVLLFARLGHYSVWDDESMVALMAKGVLKTGDTSALLGHNIVAYRNGILLKDFHDRSTPPLSAYLAAASFAIFGQNTMAARLPFALCGLMAIAFLLWWIWKSGAALATTLLFCMGILGNVSLFLYCRQCRYYGPAVLFSIAIGYFYLRYDGRRMKLVALSVLCAGLLAANPLNCFALYVCLAVDYFIYGRKEHPLGLAEWVCVIAPQAILGGIILAIWNPFHTQFGAYATQNSIAARITLFFWNWRDLNGCEFAMGALVLAAPFFGFFRKDRVLLRCCLALFMYITAVSIVSPQTVQLTEVADIRYLMPLIPLCITISVLVIGWAVKNGNLVIAAAAGAVAFFTNLLCGGPLLDRGFHSTILDYLGELTHPPGDPYTVAADWINQNVTEGASIWVEPDYMTYPLMFDAPKAVYAWQLTPPIRPEFQSLDRINFQGRVPPDYILAFGPVVSQISNVIGQLAASGARYEAKAPLDFYWRDVYRPELFWRRFTPVTTFNKEAEAIYVFKRMGSGAPTAAESH